MSAERRLQRGKMKRISGSGHCCPERTSDMERYTLSKNFAELRRCRGILPAQW
jgi:hypothetical protein